VEYGREDEPTQMIHSPASAQAQRNLEQAYVTLSEQEIRSSTQWYDRSVVTESPSYYLR
jgi:hypothetical protein